MKITFSLDAWEQYTEWQALDAKTVKRINTLLKDIVRNHPFDGLGKPEPLKGNLSGFWSRRIDGYNRLVYRIEGDVCQVVQCKGHYGQ